ncbi:heavy metal translocating P-type ATPase [Magnetospirillum molischianum]|uniref:P-type Zn(2+) transporter n=1 Tax=Magnetospirillum molischianum DSM 120 TaxID=1150626 RepID=H8FTS8_MAGML|nr:heavy metal translocating P-type ATPase [Magnetospirillum molischianum]CCG41785.1 Heavy metal translocating P-type ATPase [Magnetospirillum molischianum DSM 120]
MIPDAGWIDAVEVVHRVPGRVRLRYRSHGRPIATAPLVRAVSELDGVTAARINPAARSLILSYDPAETGAEALRASVAALLPTVQPETAPAAAPKTSSGLGSSLMTLLMTPLLPAPLRLPVALAAALPLLRHGAEDYAENGVTSHGLEAMAVSISLARADYTAANTTTFMLALGEHLEHSVARRSDDLLKHLLRPSSDEIWVMRDGEEVLIPAAEVVVGDTVVVGTGTVIPIDGTVLSGEATVNEAAMTGESVSVEKSRGSLVLSGTLVEEGRLSIYAEQVGRRTAAARIADYVEQSLVVKSEAQLEASRLADRLVPLVLKLAGAAFVVSGDWRRAASVLQADYSCALKLATPVAFKSAMYGAARAGILVKGASALERLAQADTFVFDKTGTLTTGLLQVTDAIAFDPTFTPDDLICLAASVEEHYFHPLAMAVVTAARATENHRHFDHQEVQFIVAHGVASVIDGKRIVVGSRHFVQEDEGIDITPQTEIIDQLYRDGKTLLFIGFGGRLLGVIGLKDSVRPTTVATLRRLRALGVRRILLLTGDHRDRATELADELGLDECHSELMPEDKARIIDSLAAQGARIAFVGDGINDAPALAGAHVGIAMMKGADIARLTADVALLEDDIECVADAKAAAKAAMDLIATNYRLTVGLNTGILSAAALGMLSPISTAILHNGTTLGILLNALRTRKLRAERR